MESQRQSRLVSTVEHKIRGHDQEYCTNLNNLSKYNDTLFKELKDSTLYVKAPITSRKHTKVKVCWSISMATVGVATSFGNTS